MPRLTKQQFDRLDALLEEQLNAWLTKHLGPDPADAQKLTLEEMIQRIRDGSAQLNPKTNEYSQIQHAFIFFTPAELAQQEVARKDYVQRKVKLRAQARATKQRFLDEALFGNEGVEVLNKVAAVFANLTPA